MTVYDAVQLVHVLAAMTWVGGGIMLTGLSWRVERSDDETLRMQFARASSLAGPIAGTSAMIVLIAGSVMVAMNDAWTVSQTWIWLALVLFFVSMGIGAGYYGRVGKRIEAAVAAGDAPQVDRLGRQMLRVSLIDLAVVITVVGLMVFKPGATI